MGGDEGTSHGLPRQLGRRFVCCDCQLFKWVVGGVVPSHRSRSVRVCARSCVRVCVCVCVCARARVRACTSHGLQCVCVRADSSADWGWRVVAGGGGGTARQRARLHHAVRAGERREIRNPIHNLTSESPPRTTSSRSSRRREERRGGRARERICSSVCVRVICARARARGGDGGGVPASHLIVLKRSKRQGTNESQGLVPVARSQ